MEIQDGNKLIADFMGYKYDDGDECRGVFSYWYHPDKKENGCYTKFLSDEFNYHENWSRLMPVVEKIEQQTSIAEYIGFTVEIRNRHCCIVCHEENRQPGCIYQTPHGRNPETKIKAVWDAVVAFIEWYNKEKGEICGSRGQQFY